jgi:hypothetical protein
LRPACQPDESRRASSPDGGGAPPDSAKRSNSAAEVGLFRIFGNPIGAIEVRAAEVLRVLTTPLDDAPSGFVFALP